MLRQPTTDHALFKKIIMTEKKQYTINTMSDGITSLTIAGVTELFKTRKAALHFALELGEQLSDRRVGKFRLQDTDEGKLQMIMNKSGNVINFKDYDQAEKLAEMLINDLMP